MTPRTSLRRTLRLLPTIALLAAWPLPAQQTRPAASTGGRYLSVYGNDRPRHWMAEEEVDLTGVPEEAGHHHHGEAGGSRMVMYEVTRFPFADGATDGQRRAAEALRRRSLEAAERNGWFVYEKALLSGYHQMAGDTHHYVNEEYVLDDRLLDPARPEFLMYYDTPAGKRLAGYMFLVRTPEEQGPQIGGPETVWHFHIWAEPYCLLDGLFVVTSPDEAGRCERGAPATRSPEMLHVWFVEHPMGPFGTRMKLPESVIEELARDDYVAAPPGGE